MCTKNDDDDDDDDDDDNDDDNSSIQSRYTINNGERMRHRSTQYKNSIQYKIDR